jgi:tetratricopeptide (TPR) repeat protein
MQLCPEKPTVRWIVLIVVWALVGLLSARLTNDASQYLHHLDRLGLRGETAATTPLKLPTFTFAADAETWIRYALQLGEKGELRLRNTDIDNAPYGRPVHWNSAWAWVIASAGELRHYVTGEPLPIATEQAAVWLNFWVLFVITVIMSAWAASRAGEVAGIVIALGLLGSNRFYEGFVPSYVDHHGLLAAAAFGLTLGGLFMVRGRLQSGALIKSMPTSPKDARTAAVFSAVCGAIGLWISAASAIPPIAIVGVAGLVAALFTNQVKPRANDSCDPQAWRVWGRVGALLSVVFYVVEYFPSHMALRLETNHPLYALAWWGGGEIIATICESRIFQLRHGPRDKFRFGCAIAAVSVVPLAMLFCGPNVFVLNDPFMTDLHKYIFEFKSVPEMAGLFGWEKTIQAFDLTVLSLPALTAILLFRSNERDISTVFALVSSCAFFAMGIWQERWLLNASGPLVCSSLVAIGVLSRRQRFATSYATSLLLVAFVFGPPLWMRMKEYSTLAARTAITREAFGCLFRDVAATLRSSQPSGDITLLSSPNSSTGIGYYGRFKTIGTLYWENAEGLKAAAAIFSAQTDDEAEKLIKARGITHIAMISDENFLGPYYALLHPDAKADDLKTTFGYRLLVANQFPKWLRILPYQVPSDLRPLNAKVILFKVDFSQSFADALFHLAMAQVAWGALPDASRTLDQLAGIVPNAPEPWLRKAEVFIAEREFDAAVPALERGVKLAASTDQVRLFVEGGRALQTAGAPEQACLMYRKALTSGFDAVAAYNLAWILSTSKIVAIRSGAEAVQLAEQLVKLNPNSPAFLSCYAAALAECGRTSEAAEVAVLAINKAGNDFAAAQKLASHLAEYRAGRAWRE